MTALRVSLNPIEVLKTARERIANPDNWLQGDLALTADDEGTYETSPYAAKFCSLGAIYADGRGYGYKSAVTLAEAIETLHNTGLGYHRTRPTEFVAGWNDKPKRKHSEVLAAFDLAIAMQEAAK